jgi:hypothetical protein
VLVAIANFDQPLRAQVLLPSIWEPGRYAQAVDLSEISIVVVAGDNGVNIVSKKAAVQPIVEVRDKNNLPVRAAVVNFISPDEAPSVVFSNGERTFTVITDDSGRAAVSGMRPIGIGQFHIQVTASVTATNQGHTIANATITQTNYQTPEAAANAGAASGAITHSGLSRGAIIAIIVGVAAAGAGAALGLGGKSSSSSGGSSNSSVSATIGLGSGSTVGAPH